MCYYREVVDYSMRLFPFAFFAFSALVVSALPQPAQALPFAKSCASMQAYLNAKQWKVPTKLQGFENSNFSLNDPFSNKRFYAFCDGGYITENSPMGRKVCQGSITYHYDGAYKWSSINCRYQ